MKAGKEEEEARQRILSKLNEWKGFFLKIPSNSIFCLFHEHQIAI